MTRREISFQRLRSSAKKQRLVPKNKTKKKRLIPICIGIAAEIDKIVIAIRIESLSGRNIVRGKERSFFVLTLIRSAYRASIFNSVSGVVRFLLIANSTMSTAMIVFGRKFVRIISSSLHWIACKMKLLLHCGESEHFFYEHHFQHALLTKHTKGRRISAPSQQRFVVDARQRNYLNNIALSMVLSSAVTR